MEMVGQEGVIGMTGRECSWYQYNTGEDGQRHLIRSVDEGRCLCSRIYGGIDLRLDVWG